MYLNVLIRESNEQCEGEAGGWQVVVQARDVTSTSMVIEFLLFCAAVAGVSSS